ncbi:MAG: hypothetical protein SFT92_05625 [Rickettsiales bacterium]|nr:hypothetical protein [Rickettsiales bacterium]
MSTATPLTRIYGRHKHDEIFTPIYDPASLTMDRIFRRFKPLRELRDYLQNPPEEEAYVSGMPASADQHIGHIREARAELFDRVWDMRTHNDPYNEDENARLMAEVLVAENQLRTAYKLASGKPELANGQAVQRMIDQRVNEDIASIETYLARHFGQPITTPEKQTRAWGR